MYEPIAYDKKILFKDGGWHPVVRIDDKEIFLKPADSLSGAQKVLDFFAPDVFEGLPPGNSVFYKEDRRFSPDEKFI